MWVQRCYGKVYIFFFFFSFLFLSFVLKLDLGGISSLRYVHYYPYSIAIGVVMV